MLEYLRKLWRSQSPQMRWKLKALLWTAVGFAALYLGVVATSTEKRELKRKPKDVIVFDSKHDPDKETWRGRREAELRQLQDQVSKLQSQVEASQSLIAGKVAEAIDAAGAKNKAALDERFKQMEESLKQAQKEKEQAARKPSESLRTVEHSAAEAPPLPPALPASIDSRLPPETDTGGQKIVGPEPLPIFDRKKSGPAAGTGAMVGAVQAPADPGKKEVGGGIKVYFDKDAEHRRRESGRRDAEKLIAGWLSSGSFVRGITLSGMDAPTSTGAQTNPYPILISVDQLAAMPNDRTMDIRGCFMQASGYGDLSSERAYLRLETISCIVNRDGREFVIDGHMKGYVVDNDGKVGMRGKLVTKSGQALSRALLAGLASGIAQAFSPSKVPALNLKTNGDSSTTYQMPTPGQVGEVAALQGASNAMTLLANYYISLAEQMYPVVEVGAGRPVEVVVTKGFTVAYEDKREKIRKDLTEAEMGRSGGLAHHAGQKNQVVGLTPQQQAQQLVLDTGGAGAAPGTLSGVNNLRTGKNNSFGRVSTARRQQQPSNLNTAGLYENTD